MCVLEDIFWYEKMSVVLCQNHFYVYKVEVKNTRREPNIAEMTTLLGHIDLEVLQK